MRGLEEDGVIRGYHADLDPSKLGFAITVFAMVSLKSQAESALREFEEAMVSQQQRSETTRALLMETMRESLLNQGLEATTTASILAQTGLSKGALYHHFRSKNEIIEAIYRDESHGAIRRALESVASDQSPIERLKRGCENWLKELRQRDTRRIVLDLGPQALGLERVIEIESELSLRLFSQILDQAAANGELVVSDTGLAVRLINALMTELAIAKPSSQHARALQRLA